MPIFLFTYVFCNLFYFRNQVSHEAKVSIAKSFGAGIAHEMRNPLAALKASLEVLRSILPAEKCNGHAIYEIDTQELLLANEILDDAEEVIRTGNETIDLLLTSIDENRVSTSSFRKHNIRHVIEHVIKSYSYKNAMERMAVSLAIKGEYEFFGSDTLLKYAVYNLMKNAFYYQNGPDFKIHITIEKTGASHFLRVRDTGVGIEPEKIDDIFKDFYTSGKNGSYGLGLPFCRKVMASLGGSITCQSELGCWTEFTLIFPPYYSETVDQIKADLIKSKSLLYIGGNSVVGRHLNEVSFYQGFKLNNVTLQGASKREDYDFEFDLIMVDLDHAESDPQLFRRLEEKLACTDAMIIYLYDKRHVYHHNIERHLTVYPLDKGELLLDSQSVIDKFLFEPGALEPNRNKLPKHTPKTRRCILIVDDNQSLRTFTSILLEKQGFDVLQAEDGQCALSVIEKEPIDLILMDLEMPGLDGIEVTHKIRQSDSGYRDIPIICHTGDNSASAIKRIQMSGMNDFVVKPVDKDLLFSKLANWL